MSDPNEELALEIDRAAFKVTHDRAIAKANDDLKKLPQGHPRGRELINLIVTLTKNQEAGAA